MEAPNSWIPVRLQQFFAGIGLIVFVVAIFYALLFIQQFIITGGLDDPGEQIAAVFLSISFVLYLFGMLFISLGNIWSRNMFFGIISFIENVIYIFTFGIFFSVITIREAKEGELTSLLVLLGSYTIIAIHSYMSIFNLKETFFAK